MKLNLFLLLCLTGFLPVTLSNQRTVPHKYDLMLTTMTWPNAQNYCRRTYTDLATILSDTDWLRYTKVAGSQGLVLNTWTGLYKDIYNWRWTLNDIPLKNVPFTNWAPGEPDNFAGNDLCVIIAGYNYWYDITCTIIRPFICYNAKISGAPRFVGISNPQLTWPDARAYCQTYYTDLASSLNSSDDAMLVQLKVYQGDSWIGLYRDRDIWKWSDGTSASNIPWYPGQPDNYEGSENCAIIHNKQFYDQRCYYMNYVLCETISPMRSQIMRLQVGSKANMFDPAMQTLILEQIKQKLKENGMLNTTVTWKVQPDGNIFHKKKKTYN